MASDVYVGLSGQIAMERRLHTVANNVANLATVGFRAEEVLFETLISDARSQETAFASAGGSFTSIRPGPVRPTGNPLDVAVVGDGWLGLETPAGPVYTRDGRMTMTEAGDLVSVTGYPVLDRGGGPIALNPGRGLPEIASDGTITQQGDRVGALGIFLIPPTAGLARFSDAGVMPDVEPVLADDLIVNGVRQGFVEGGNVNPVSELTRLVIIQRQFESLATALESREGTMRTAVQDLGPSR